MSVKDILFPMTAYPVATSSTAIENAVDFADSLGAQLSAIVNEMSVSPDIGLFLDFQHVGPIIEAEFEKSRKLAQVAVHEFETAANAAGISHRHVVAGCVPAEFASRVVKEAHFRDLSMVAIGENGVEQDVAEALVFEFGRPVLIFPGEPSRELPRSIDTVALAWDFSGPATRAIADAFPLLQRAKTVRIFTVTGDKVIARPDYSTTVSDYLGKHGINAISDEVKSSSQPIGEVFATYIKEHRIDLLVMGAYGHSKLREFVLGGATRSVIVSPPTWVLLSR